MKPFFDTEDFVIAGSAYHNMIPTLAATTLANAKLEREGKVVYRPEDATEVWIDNEKDSPTHKALLINIQEIKPCDHKNTTKTEVPHGYDSVYRCSCGARLKEKTITTYEEIK
jgi:hypothetical protein